MRACHRGPAVLLPELAVLHTVLFPALCVHAVFLFAPGGGSPVLHGQLWWSWDRAGTRHTAAAAEQGAGVYRSKV